MLETLRIVDTKILLWINGEHNAFLDFIMFWVSDKLIWIPFYILLLATLYRNYQKQTLWFLPVVALLIAGCDQLSGLIKNTTLRFRPCHEPTLNGMIHLVHDYCGGDYGFVSSHAANSVGLTTFMMMMLPAGNKKIRIALIVYVLLLGYSRMYLGAHYPLDILGGWTVGFVLGFTFAKLLQQKIKVPQIISSNNE